MKPSFAQNVLKGRGAGKDDDGGNAALERHSSQSPIGVVHVVPSGERPVALRNLVAIQKKASGLLVVRHLEQTRVSFLRRVVRPLARAV